jgi:hypothetical protein
MHKILCIPPEFKEIDRCKMVENLGLAKKTAPGAKKSLTKTAISGRMVMYGILWVDEYIQGLFPHKEVISGDLFGPFSSGGNDSKPFFTEGGDGLRDKGVVLSSFNFFTRRRKINE